MFKVQKSKFKVQNSKFKVNYYKRGLPGAACRADFLRTLRALGSGEPPQIKFYTQTHFCLLAPAQLFTLLGFSNWVIMGGTPRGQYFGSPPGLVGGVHLCPRLTYFTLLFFHRICKIGQRPSAHNERNGYETGCFLATNAQRNGSPFW